MTRIFELAKELNLSNKEMVSAVERLGIQVKNHMSSLTDDQVLRVRKILHRAPVEAEPAPAAPAPEAAAVSAEPVAEAANVDPSAPVLLKGPIMVRDFAAMLGVKPNKLIGELMKMNVFASINAMIEFRVAQVVGEKLGRKVELDLPKKAEPPPPPPPPPAPETATSAAEDQPSAPAAEGTTSAPAPKKKKIKNRAGEEVQAPELTPEERIRLRPPVVTVMGHVDHGKTSLLDKIRNAKVAAGEAGGITQHIGAYVVQHGGHSITFLDTPGHEAFTKMRARGASLTDIIILVVAADQGMQPQTKEAIRLARGANVPIIVAINKIDLPNANVDRIKQQLQGDGLLPEDWGGDTICVPVSAATGKGVNDLLDYINLQSEVLELKTDPKAPTSAYVIEAQLEPGMGPTASVLVKNGTLTQGDAFLVGPYWGKVKGMINDRGERVKEATASTPVKLVGLSEVPEAGSELVVSKNEKTAKAESERMLQDRRTATLKGGVATRKLTLEDLFTKPASERLEFPIVLKCDVQGSMEAIVQMLSAIPSQKISIKYIATAIGPVSDNDVQLAQASGAKIFAFNVSTVASASKLAKQNGVEIREYRIIYEMQDDTKALMTALLPPILRVKITGHAEVRALFKLNKQGNIAGCMVTDGKIYARSKVRVMRKKDVLFEGAMGSLRRFQNDASEVRDGQECGIRVEGFWDFEPGDVIEAFEVESIPQELG